MESHSPKKNGKMLLPESLLLSGKVSRGIDCTAAPICTGLASRLGQRQVSAVLEDLKPVCLFLKKEKIN